MRFAGVALLALCGVAMAQPTPPSPVPAFPLDWTSVEEDFAIMYQGQYTQSGDNYCCSDDNCEVQTQYQSGHNYFDYTHNRTRFDDPVQGSIVSLFFPIWMEMAVDNTNTCTSYCPIDTDDGLEPYGIDPNATDMGQKVIDNRTLEMWESTETLFGKIIMETDDIYVDETKNPAIPYKEIDYLTPFGEAIGTETSTYLSFVAGTPPASLFAVKGIKECPQDSNCNDNSRQRIRRKNKSWNTWTKSYLAVKNAKAAKMGKRLTKH